MIVRAYRALLAILLPSRFHDAFADDMVGVFSELARRRGARALFEELPGLIALAVRARRSDRTTRAHEVDSRLEENMLDSLTQDIRFAVRALLSAPAFSLVAILTLALGIGANSAIFSVVNGVLLRPLAFPDPERLVSVRQVEIVKGVSNTTTVSAVNLDDWRARRRMLVDIGGYFYIEGMSGTDLTGIGEPQRISTTFVSPGFWNTLGVAPEVGRVPRDEEMVRGANDKLVVLSHDFWQRQFGGERSVVGRRVTLGGDSYEIVGVMPPTFRFPAPDVQMYIPFSTIPDQSIPRIRPVRIMNVVARMKPGVTIAQASAEMNVITRGLAAEYEDDRNLGGAAVTPLRDSIVGKVRASLLVLLGAVGFVLIIAAVNLASLLLARATSRERELAIRVALGAGRSRVIRQLCTESMVLAIVGGVLGIGVAVLGKAGLLRLAAGQLPRAEEVGLDYRVVLFTAGLTIVTGVAFGLIPAIRASSPELQQSLREGSRGATSAAGGLRNALVVAEVALAVVLVVGAGLMTRSFVKLLQVDLGFKRDHRVVVNYSISTARHSTAAEMRDTYREMLNRVRQVPGVIAAGAVRDIPFRGDGETIGFMPPGVTRGADGELPRATLMFTSDGFFSTMGIPLVAGRDLSQQDRIGAPIALVVNEALAKKYFPDRSPIGQTITFGDTNHFAIVGVVGDVHQGTVDETPAPRIYASAYQIFRVKVNLVVRAQGDPQLMIKRIEDAVRAVDRQQTFTGAFTLDDAVGEAVARPRLLAVLLGLFGTMGLVLGALGIYGVLSYLVTQRTREIGVRVALGARASSVLGMIVWRGLRLAGLGVLVGIAAALALTRLMQGVLYGVTPTDPLTFVGVALTLLAVAAGASWIPAWRATKVDPLVALRAE
ncbi:MAG TPA: ABC transporter permease [Gemmatimonadaceae bacterium]|nr:ABC transporter permease [Gemmatimonadaceae bacterium]